MYLLTHLLEIEDEYTVPATAARVHLVRRGLRQAWLGASVGVERRKRQNCRHTYDPVRAAEVQQLKYIL